MTRMTPAFTTAQFVLLVSVFFAAAMNTAHAIGDDNKLRKIEKLVSLNENVRGDLDKASRKLEYAVESLRALINASEDGAKKAYGKFKNDAEEFRKQSIDAQNKIRDVQKEADKFFAGWKEDEARITSERRKTRSQNRRTATQAAFGRHISAFKEVQDIFIPAVAELSPLVERLKDNFGARMDASVAEAQAKAVRLSDDIYWQVDNAIAKTEIFR